MSQSNHPEISLHVDGDFFRQALAFTAAQTGFDARLIEKDYFATLVLSSFSSKRSSRLVFKGGTCLAKVHAGFYRLSEDLDFMIPIERGIGRRERGRLAEGAKEALNDVVRNFGEISVEDELRGANESRQYLGTLGYRSFLSGGMETLKIEVSLREPLCLASVELGAQTILLNPISEVPALGPVVTTCMVLEEAMAEKYRAALSTRRIAIRDFYDIDYARQHGGGDLQDPAFIELVRRKLSIQGNTSEKPDDQKLQALRNQAATRLKTVLRPQDYRAFDLERAIAMVGAVADAL